MDTEVVGTHLFIDCGRVRKVQCIYLLQPGGNGAMSITKKLLSETELQPTPDDVQSLLAALGCTTVDEVESMW